MHVNFTDDKFFLKINMRTVKYYFTEYFIHRNIWSSSCSFLMYTDKTNKPIYKELKIPKFHQTCQIHMERTNLTPADESTPATDNTVTIS
jgi:hypothetical protein